MFDTEETNAQDSAGQNPYRQNGAGQNLYGQSEAGQNPYGQSEAGQNPYGQSEAEQNPYGQSEAEQDPYRQNGAEADPYGQAHTEQEYNRTDAYTQNTTQGFYQENKAGQSGIRNYIHGIRDSVTGAILYLYQYSISDRCDHLWYYPADKKGNIKSNAYCRNCYLCIINRTLYCGIFCFYIISRFFKRHKRWFAGVPV